jgi:hypothetical protein
MSVSLDQLDDFHRFALQQVLTGGAESLAELARQWEVGRERAEVNQALDEAIEDLRAGRYQPAADVSREMRRKYNLPE